MRFVEDLASTVLGFGVLGYLLLLIISRNGLIALNWIMLVTSAHLPLSCKHTATADTLSACVCVGDKLVDD